MVEYQIYTVGSDWHFIDFRPLVCDNDDEAIDTAKRLVDGRDIEVWSGDRFVIRLPQMTK